LKKKSPIEENTEEPPPPKVSKTKTRSKTRKKPTFKEAAPKKTKSFSAKKNNATKEFFESKDGIELIDDGEEIGRYAFHKEIVNNKKNWTMKTGTQIVLYGYDPRVVCYCIGFHHGKGNTSVAVHILLTELFDEDRVFPIALTDILKIENEQSKNDELLEKLEKLFEDIKEEKKRKE